jgi:Flp pilus assembly protein TadG
MKKSLSFKRSEKGQSLVELAVSLIALLVLLAGVADLSRIALAYMATRDAAQEGATYGSINPTACTEIINRTQQSASGTFGPGAVNVTVTINGKQCGSAGVTDACVDKEVRVDVNKPDFPITMPFLGAIIGSQEVALNSFASDTILGPACP